MTKISQNVLFFNENRMFWGQNAFRHEVLLQLLSATMCWTEKTKTCEHSIPPGGLLQLLSATMSMCWTEMTRSARWARVQVGRGCLARVLWASMSSCPSPGGSRVLGRGSGRRVFGCGSGRWVLARSLLPDLHF